MVVPTGRTGQAQAPKGSTEQQGRQRPEPQAVRTAPGGEPSAPVFCCNNRLLQPPPPDLGPYSIPTTHGEPFGWRTLNFRRARGIERSHEEERMTAKDFSLEIDARTCHPACLMPAVLRRATLAVAAA